MSTILRTIAFISFLFNSLGPIPAAQAQDFYLPAPGVRLNLSAEFNPPILSGIKVHPEDPLRLDFILDNGDSRLTGDRLREESSKLIKYFLASLTIPENDLWVNLSPYEKDRIIPQSFGLTEMGRDLLAEDYMLKQITASLIYPEERIGKRFWERVYKEVAQKYGTTNIPVNTFNKVWIVPDKTVVYENAKAGTAYVVQAKLKVMLEQDYLSLKEHAAISPKEDVNALGTNIVREIVIPELVKEVNKGRNFYQLRQVFNSLILATWYKRKIQASILTQVYDDKSKVKGVSIDDPQEKQRIYHRYLQAFKRGAYNFVKEEIDPVTKEIIPRKYFSGGLEMAIDDKAMVMTQKAETVQGVTTNGKVDISVTLSSTGTTDEDRTPLANPTTFSGRLARSNQMMFDLIDERARHSSEVTVLDIGVGYPPVTTIELQRDTSAHLRQKNMKTRVEVIGIDSFKPAGLVKLPGNSGITVNQISSNVQRMLRFDRKDPVETLVMRNAAEIGFAVAEGIFYNRTSKFPAYDQMEEMAQGVKKSFKGRLSALVSRYILPIIPLSVAMPLLKILPVVNNPWAVFENRDVKLIEGDYRDPKIDTKPADIVRIFNVEGKIDRDSILHRMKEGAYLEIGYSDKLDSASEKIGLYQKRNGRLHPVRLMISLKKDYPHNRFFSWVGAGLIKRDWDEANDMNDILDQGTLNELINETMGFTEKSHQSGGFFKEKEKEYLHDVDRLAEIYADENVGGEPLSGTWQQRLFDIDIYRESTLKSTRDPQKARELFKEVEQLIERLKTELMGEIIERLNERGFKASIENGYIAVEALPSQAMRVQGPKIAVENGALAKGGIDLTPANMNLQTKNANGIIKFHLDPVMLAQFQHASGFMVGHMVVEPLSSVSGFLGITDTKNLIHQ